MQSKQNYLKPYHKALSRARETGGPVKIGEALSELGVALFKIDEFEQGAENLDLAISVAAKSGDKSLTAIHIGTKGLVLMDAGNFEAAAQCFQQVIDIADELDNPGLRSDALGNFGMVFVETGDASLAFSNLQEAIDLAQNLGDQQREMFHVGNLGHAHLLVADIENALMCFNRAMDLARELKDQRSEAGYLTNQGVLAVRLDDQEKIIDIFEKVRDLTRKTGDLAGEMNALNQLIKAYTALDREEVALVYTQAAQKLAQRHNELKSDPYDNALVAQLFNLNRSTEAFDQLEKSIEDARAQSDNLRELELLTNLGSAYFTRHKIEDASRSWKNAVDLAAKMGKNHDQAKLWGYLSMAAGESGNVEESIAWSHKAMELAGRIENRRIVGEQQIFLSLAYRDLDEVDKARDYCQQAVASFEQVGLTEFEEKARQLSRELAVAS